MKLSFYKNKRVLVTGHTGFKGAWLCGLLLHAGAEVTGYALAPPSGGAFELCGWGDAVDSHIGDIRDLASLQAVFEKTRPEIVLHMAAQPLVLDGFERPVYTFDTNVMGTANLLECVRLSGNVRSVIVVTTDKVYRNTERPHGYREDDTLGGHDPYAASKACAELVATSYSDSFLKERNISLSTARAGNVIGGGDISANRILPDCVRATLAGEAIVLRNPDSVRPYQHVLEPLSAYLLLAQKQWEQPALAGGYNVGPEEDDCLTTAELAAIFCESWGPPARWEAADKNESAHHEAGLLRLDCEKARSALGWLPRWDSRKAVEMTVCWEKNRAAGENPRAETDRQIQAYLKETQGGNNDV